MNLWAFLLPMWAFSFTSPMPSLNVTDMDGEPKDVSNMNKGLLLIKGDIMMPIARSSILSRYWREIPVPYVLSTNLSMNVKGVILRAFERFRLKSCVDFKPRTTEKSFISVENEGCSSYVGQQSISKSQTLFVGYCGYIGMIEHLFLHALGFYHEETRYDRDAYVTIRYNKSIAGSQINFKINSKNVSSVQGTPYDYMSVMHSDKNYFSNGNGSTIITKNPGFQDVIGQRFDMSEYDAIELNSLYKCKSSTSFLHHCSFDDDSLCQMSFCSSTEHGWLKVSSVMGVNVTDHTNMDTKYNVSSFFMHFSLKGRKEGDSARLETRKMTPTRDRKVQCLQFYYYHSGNKNDKLNIWMREYQNKVDSIGVLRLWNRITGPSDNYWRLHHVSLKANKPFSILFEARKGAGNSSGGFSLDDINIAEIECPKIWQIRNFRQLNKSSANGSYQSPLYYSSEGYRYQVLLKNFNTYFSMYVRLVSGVYDDKLQWPCPWRHVTLQVLDQNPHMQKRMSYERSITTDPTSPSGNRLFWDNPRKNGTKTNIGYRTVFVTKGLGYSPFMFKSDLTKREFIKGGDIIFLFSMQDTPGLLQNNSVSCPNMRVNRNGAIQNQGATSVKTLLFSLVLFVGFWPFLLN